MPVTGDAYVDAACVRCGLCRDRTQVVPAEGGRSPLAFFVGEAPGPDEDAQGRPFIGRAGKILRRALAEAGWREDEVWITNVVKCFPHELEGGRRRIRKPTREEVAACRPHLAAEVAALRPKLIVALGQTAAQGLLGLRNAKLSELRGRPHAAAVDLASSPVWVTYHPSGLHYGHATVEEFTQDLARARGGLSP